MKLLVVDDNAVSAETIAELLRIEGHTVEVAGNGFSALALLDVGLPPDVIILDLRMPSMNGGEFLARLRANDLYRLIPVVVLSAATDAEIDAIKPWGRIIAVQKPFDPAALPGLLQAAKAMKSSGDESCSNS